MKPEDVQKVREQLEHDWPAIEAARNELESYARLVCARLSGDSGFRQRFVESRSKASPSVVDKLDRKGPNREDMYEAIGDLIGARVVVYNLSDAVQFRDSILNDEACPLAQVTEEPVEKDSGYRAIHLNGRLRGFRCEIQVRTAVQDAWAVTSRADVYKSPGTPLIEILSNAQSNVLRGVDDVLQAIRDLTEESRPKVLPPATAEEAEPEAQVVFSGSEGLNHQAVQETIAGLADDERYVLDSKISDAKLATLKLGIEAEREASTIRQLFRAVGKFARVYEYRSNSRFGTRIFAWKGPLIAGSNWVEFLPREFSRALEGHLLQQLSEILRGGLPAVASAPLNSGAAVLEFIEQIKSKMTEVSAIGDVVVISGDVDRALRLDLLRLADWQTSPSVRGYSLAGTTLAREVLGILPTIWIHDGMAPFIQVVDLSDFVYEQTNPDLMGNDDLLVRADEISFESAVTALDKTPELLKSLYRSHHGKEGAFSREEAVVRLQLQVQLNIIEGGRIQQIAKPKVQGSALLAAGGVAGR